jgi:hypothetical protein
MDKVGREGFQKIHKNQAAILDEIWSLIVPNIEKIMQIQGQIKWLLDEFA